MTDKVQKIREWVKARLDENSSKQSLPQFYGMMEEDARFLDFLDSLQEELVSDDLEEAAMMHYKDVMGRKIITGLETANMTSFKAGANWKEQKMMANAIEGKVIANGMGNPILHLWDKGKHLIDKKVKVIIVKED